MTTSSTDQIPLRFPDPALAAAIKAGDIDVVRTLLPDDQAGVLGALAHAAWMWRPSPPMIAALWEHVRPESLSSVVEILTGCLTSDLKVKSGLALVWPHVTDVAVREGFLRQALVEGNLVALNAVWPESWSPALWEQAIKRVAMEPGYVGQRYLHRLIQDKPEGADVTSAIPGTACHGYISHLCQLLPLVPSAYLLLGAIEAVAGEEGRAQNECLGLLLNAWDFPQQTAQLQPALESAAASGAVHNVRALLAVEPRRVATEQALCLAYGTSEECVSLLLPLSDVRQALALAMAQKLPLAVAHLVYHADAPPLEAAWALVQGHEMARQHLQPLWEAHRLALAVEALPAPSTPRIRF